jgi:hypothetical protein
MCNFAHIEKVNMPLLIKCQIFSNEILETVCFSFPKCSVVNKDLVLHHRIFKISYIRRQY